MSVDKRTPDGLVDFVRDAHRGQTDKSCVDYFVAHLLPVARSVPGHLFFAALAHDILEDTDTTAKDLRDAGFSEFDIGLIELLTKKSTIILAISAESPKIRTPKSSR